MDALCTDRVCPNARLDSMGRFNRMLYVQFVFMHSSDLTIIFDVIAALTSPSILARVRLHRQPHLESPLQPLTASESSALFDAIAQLLLSIVRLRKPELVHSIPSLFAVLRTLFACFRTLGDSDNNVMDQTLIRLTSSKSLQFSNEPHNPFRIDPFPLLTARAPLPPQNAETFSRILVAIAQKSAAEGTSGGTTQKIASETTVKPFVKYAPNLIAEYVGLLLLRPSGSNAWWGPPPAAQRASLVEGIYALLDICRPSEREHLLACMDHPAAGGAGGKLVLKNLVQDWNRFHRYAGKV
ncbi:Urb2/Npa2 family-domain-containing protein [Cladochytrium replicatum]|nr:Urb2/Npa2 family-domain-containing protein [Cladochytrium replicatum]